MIIMLVKAKSIASCLGLSIENVDRILLPIDGGAFHLIALNHRYMNQRMKTHLLVGEYFPSKRCKI